MFCDGKPNIPRLGMTLKPTQGVDAQTTACYKCRPRIKGYCSVIGNLGDSKSLDRGSSPR